MTFLAIPPDDDARIGTETLGNKVSLRLESKWIVLVLLYLATQASTKL